jgi:hypothetical protein
MHHQSISTHFDLTDLSLLSPSSSSRARLPTGGYKATSINTFVIFIMHIKHQQTEQASASDISLSIRLMTSAHSSFNRLHSAGAFCSVLVIQCFMSTPKIEREKKAKAMRSIRVVRAAKRSSKSIKARRATGQAQQRPRQIDRRSSSFSSSRKRKLIYEAINNSYSSRYFRNVRVPNKLPNDHYILFAISEHSQIG